MLYLMGRFWILILLACVACGAMPRPAGADGALDGASSQCGNGTIESELGEQCDDGSGTASGSSLCTKQCLDAHAIHHPRSHFHVPNTPTRVVPITTPDSFSVAYLAEESPLVQLVRQTNAYTRADQVETIGSTAPVTALADLQIDSNTHPIWIESDGSSQRMFFAEIDQSNPPIIHEIPYPFQDGEHGVLTAVSLHATYLFDQSNVPPYDLLVAAVVTRSISDIAVFTARFPAPGRKRGVLINSGFGADPTEGVTRLDYQAIQFFDDNNSYITIQSHPGDNTDAAILGLNTPYAFLEMGRGAVPFHVVDGDRWIELSGGSQSPSVSPQNEHPMPVVVAADDGGIYVFRPDGTPISEDGEGFVLRYATAPPSPFVLSINGTFGGSPGNALSNLWLLGADGVEHYFEDSSQDDIASPSLAPQSFPATGAWVHGFASKYVENGGLPVFSVDQEIFLWI